MRVGEVKHHSRSRFDVAMSMEFAAVVRSDRPKEFAVLLNEAAGFAGGESRRFVGQLGERETRVCGTIDSRACREKDSLASRLRKRKRSFLIL